MDQDVFLGLIQFGFCLALLWGTYWAKTKFDRTEGGKRFVWVVVGLILFVWAFALMVEAFGRIIVE